MTSVLHISTSDNAGGSGRSAYRIHTGIRQIGLQSRMLVGRKVTDDPDVDLIAGRLGEIDRFADRITGRMSWQYLFYPSSIALLQHPWMRQASVVQLYNTHGGYFSHTVLPLIGRRHAIVWRLSDMWAMTGHCAYSFDCERWRTGCGACPILSHKPELYRDTTARLFQIKEAVYSRTALTIVAPSQWIAGLARESPLLSRFPVHVIPNGLDTEIFKPVPKAHARRVLGIGEERRVILFSADSVADARKGAAYFRDALAALAGTAALAGALLLIAGGDGNTMGDDLPFETLTVGHVAEDKQLAMVYSAADIFVLPTLAENLPNGILESMACGTPCVTFDVGGCSDAVRHLESGYLAAHRDAGDLARGIELVLRDDALRERLGLRCREIAVAEYGIELQARRFQKLYEEVSGPSRRAGTMLRPPSSGVPGPG